MATSKTKRFETAKLTKSDKNLGPTTYNTEKAYKRTSSFRMPINIPISGLAPTVNTIKQSEKLKVKQNRFLDQVVKQMKARPSVGQYQNAEKGMFRLSTMPTSLKIRRH